MYDIFFQLIIELDNILTNSVERVQHRREILWGPEQIFLWSPKKRL